MLLPQAGAVGELSCRFELTEGALRVTVTVPTAAATLPERDTFAWTVLSALAGEVDAGSGEGTIYISLLKRRALPLLGGSADGGPPTGLGAQVSGAAQGRLT